MTEFKLSGNTGIKGSHPARVHPAFTPQKKKSSKSLTLDEFLPYRNMYNALNDRFIANHSTQRNQAFVISVIMDVTLEIA